MIEPLILIYACADLCLALQISLSNLLVIWVYVKSRHVRTPTNAYIFSLAITDFLAGALGIPTTVYSVLTREPRQFTACLTVHLCLCVLCTISTFHLLAIAIDKYLTICCKRCQLFDQHHASRHRRSKILIAMAWLLGIVIGSLPLLDAFGFASSTRRLFTDECHFTKVVDYRYLVYVIFFGTIIIPTLVIAFCYTAIYGTIHSEERQIKCLLRAAERQRRIHNRRKIIRIMLILVLTYALCWYPLYLLNTLDFYNPSDSWLHSTPPATLAAVVLSHLNCALNPLIYAYGVPGFKHSLRRFLPLNDQVTGTANGGSAMKHYYVYDMLNTVGGITPPHYSQIPSTMLYGRHGAAIKVNDKASLKAYHRLHSDSHALQQHLQQQQKQPGEVRCNECGHTKSPPTDASTEPAYQLIFGLPPPAKSAANDVRRASHRISLIQTDNNLVNDHQPSADKILNATTVQLGQLGNTLRSQPLLNANTNLLPKLTEYSRQTGVTSLRTKSLGDIFGPQMPPADKNRSLMKFTAFDLSAMEHTVLDGAASARRQLDQSSHGAGVMAKRYLIAPIREFFSRSGLRDQHRKSDFGGVVTVSPVSRMHRASLQSPYVNQKRRVQYRKSAIEVDIAKEYPMLLSRLTGADNCRCISTSTTTSSSSASSFSDDEDGSSLATCSACKTNYRRRRCRSSCEAFDPPPPAPQFQKTFKTMRERRNRLSRTLYDIKTQLQTLRVLKNGENNRRMARHAANASALSPERELLQITSTPTFSEHMPEDCRASRRHTTQQELKNLDEIGNGIRFAPIAPTSTASPSHGLCKFFSEPLVVQTDFSLENFKTPLKNVSKPSRPSFNLSPDSDDTGDDQTIHSHAFGLRSAVYEELQDIMRRNSVKPSPV